MPLKLPVRPILKPKPVRLPKGKRVSVGIAAICNRGANIICATDGARTTEISADLSAFKMQVYGEWVFLFAGTMSNIDLIMEELRQSISDDPTLLSRKKVQIALKTAYLKRRSEWLADRNLAAYDLTIEEFKNYGLKMFGEKLFSELDLSIRQDVQNFNEYVTVTGWGGAHQSAMIYTVSPDGSGSSIFDGFATIGSGASVAHNTLMLLKCARHQPFEYALYAVTAAKFASEDCEGVGRSTALMVTHKRKSPDDKFFTLIQPEQIDKLRVEWEKYSKPRIPPEALPTLLMIAQDVMGYVSPDPAIKAMAESLNVGTVHLKIGTPD